MSISKWKQYGCYVTTVVILLNVLIFIWQFLQTGSLQMDGRLLYDYGAMVPDYIERHEWYRLVMAMFLHFDLKHIGNNMLVLAMIGSMIEKPMGSVSFALVYFLGGILGNVFSAWHYARTGANVIAAGASGAVFAISGALVFLVLVNRRNMDRELSLSRVGIFVVLLVAQCFSQQGVDNYAHLGGLVSGFILTALWWVCIGNRRKIRLSRRRGMEGNGTGYEN